MHEPSLDRRLQRRRCAVDGFIDQLNELVKVLGDQESAVLNGVMLEAGVEACGGPNRRDWTNESIEAIGCQKLSEVKRTK
jgi:hypothetical protein